MHTDTDGLKSAKVQKSKSIEKDFVALAGTSQKGAKQLLKLADSKTGFTDHPNSFIRPFKTSRTPADAHRLCDEHEQSQRERA